AQRGKCGEPQTVTRLEADPAGLAAQDRAVVPEHQQLAILVRLAPGQHHQAAEQTAHGQLEDRKDHSAMIPTRQAVQARSSNRAPQDGGYYHPTPGDNWTESSSEAVLTVDPRITAE